MVKTIFITGGAGFIGSHVIRRFVTNYPDYKIINLDTLTYAGNLENLDDIASQPNYKFEKADISDFKAIERLFDLYKPDGVIHLAAESHITGGNNFGKPLFDFGIVFNIGISHRTDQGGTALLFACSDVIRLIQIIDNRRNIVFTIACQQRCLNIQVWIRVILQQRTQARIGFVVLLIGNQINDFQLLPYGRKIARISLIEKAI